MKFKKYLNVILPSVFVLIFAFWCFFGNTPDYSESERRQLAGFPEVSFETISSGEFAKDFEEYTTDRFPLRDGWRSVKAYTRLNLFMQKENNDLYVKDGHISKLEYPMNENMLDYAANLFGKVQQKYFQGNKCYIAIIPDKNKYLAELKFDYDEFYNYMYGKMPFCTPIKIDELLSADDYYFTDSHWKQERIIDVARHIANSMSTDIPEHYVLLNLDTEFYGVYAGQSALKVKPDVINYLTNKTIKEFKVSGANAVYDMQKAEGKDPYELFLSGNQPLVKIENPNGQDNKKLVVFRDSYASSIAPLLAQGYSEVTLVDLRYMNSAILDQFVDFEGSDVLFLYSTSVLNNSTSMK
ncbi:MAG: hypothetical protein IIW94_01565 [Clostridia bacterium]|nr:hypothetical protein [Clostridia bacterium]